MENRSHNISVVCQLWPPVSRPRLDEDGEIWSDTQGPFTLPQRSVMSGGELINDKCQSRWLTWGRRKWAASPRLSEQCQNWCSNVRVYVEGGRAVDASLKETAEHSHCSQDWERNAVFMIILIKTYRRYNIEDDDINDIYDKSIDNSTASFFNTVYSSFLTTFLLYSFLHLFLHTWKYINGWPSNRTARPSDVSLQRVSNTVSITKGFDSSRYLTLLMALHPRIKKSLLQQ